MATGDLRGNLERLRVQLLSIQYPHVFDVQGLRHGIPAAILPLLHYALLGYSRHLARFLSTNGYELYAKSDLRFVESTLKFLRCEFSYRSALTIGQIFSRGYAERKLLFVYDVIQMSKRKHNELMKLAHEKKSTEKVDPRHVNRDTANPDVEKNATAICSPFKEMKPWEDTLRKSEIKDKGSVGAVVAQTAQSDSFRLAPDKEVEDDAVERCGGNISPSKTPPCGRVFADQHEVNNAYEYLAEGRSHTSDEPTGETRNKEDLRSDHSGQVFEQDHHDKLCQKIMDIAERLEARFAKLEDGITKARETLEKKLVTLECRVHRLERAVPSQEIDSSKDLQQQNHNDHSSARSRSRENLHDDNGHSSACPPSRENVQNLAYEQTSWMSSHKDAASIVGPSPSLKIGVKSGQIYNAINELAAGVNNSPPIRDISNTHQCTIGKKSHLELYANKLDKPYPLFNNKVLSSQESVAVDLERQNFLETSAMLVQQLSSTQEFIAGIKARVNRTLELLSSEGHVIKPQQAFHPRPA